MALLTHISPDAHNPLKTSAVHPPILLVFEGPHDRGRQWGGPSMDTLASALACRHTKFAIKTTRPTEFIDLTDRLDLLVAEAGLRSGFVNVQTLHTTTAIVVNEHEPLLLTDFVSMLERTAPDDATYRHDDKATRTVNVTADERNNGHAHCRALLLSPSVCLNVVDGRLQLGRWQRVFLAELDGPRPREISVLLLGEAWR